MFSLRNIIIPPCYTRTLFPLYHICSSMEAKIKNEHVSFRIQIFYFAAVLIINHF